MLVINEHCNVENLLVSECMKRSDCRLIQNHKTYSATHLLVPNLVKPQHASTYLCVWCSFKKLLMNTCCCPSFSNYLYMYIYVLSCPTLLIFKLFFLSFCCPSPFPFSLRLRNIRYMFNFLMFLLATRLVYIRSRIAREVWSSFLGMCLLLLRKLGFPALQLSM